MLDRSLPVAGQYNVSFADFCDYYGQPEIAMQHNYGGSCIQKLSWRIPILLDNNYSLQGLRLRSGAAEAYVDISFEVATRNLHMDHMDYIPLEYNKNNQVIIRTIIMNIYKNKTAAELVEILKR